MSTNARLKAAEKRAQRLAAAAGDGLQYLAILFGDIEPPANMAPDGLVIRLSAECATLPDVQRYIDILESAVANGSWDFHAERQLMMLSPEWDEFIAPALARVRERERQLLGD